MIFFMKSAEQSEFLQFIVFVSPGISFSISFLQKLAYFSHLFRVIKGGMCNILGSDRVASAGDRGFHLLAND